MLLLYTATPKPIVIKLNLQLTPAQYANSTATLTQLSRDLAKLLNINPARVSTTLTQASFSRVHLQANTVAVIATVTIEPDTTAYTSTNPSTYSTKSQTELSDSLTATPPAQLSTALGVSVDSVSAVKTGAAAHNAASMLSALLCMMAAVALARQ